MGRLQVTADLLQHCRAVLLNEKKRKDYTFWRECNETPSIIPSCPGGLIFNKNKLSSKKDIRNYTFQRECNEKPSVIPGC